MENMSEYCRALDIIAKTNHFDEIVEEEQRIEPITSLPLSSPEQLQTAEVLSEEIPTSAELISSAPNQN